MGRYRIDDDLKKVRLSLSLSKYLVDYLKSMDNYSSFVENLILISFNEKECNNKENDK